MKKLSLVLFSLFLFTAKAAPNPSLTYNSSTFEVSPRDLQFQGHNDPSSFMGWAGYHEMILDNFGSFLVDGHIAHSSLTLQAADTIINGADSLNISSLGPVTISAPSSLTITTHDANLGITVPGQILGLSFSPYPAGSIDYHSAAYWGLATVAQLTAATNGFSFTPFQVTASGLVATVGAGVLNFPDGSSASVSQQTVNLTPSSVNNIVIRLDATYSAHSLYRVFDSASVKVATIVAGSSTVTSINQVTNIVIPYNVGYPINNLERLGLPFRDLYIGDSLTYGAGGSPMWFDLLYNPTYVGNGYNLPNRANSTLVRKGLPGGVWTFGALMMSDTFMPGSPAFASWGYDHPNQCWATMPLSNYELNTSYTYLGTNPYAEKTPDRVIINFGTNYDPRQLEKVEAQACYWQRRGARVFLGTGIQRYDGPTSANVIDPNWKVMTDSHGFGIIDWDAYYQEARNNNINFGGTNPTSGDNVHPSTFGQTVLAGTTRADLVPVNYQNVPPINMVSRRVLYTNTLSAPHAQACYTYTVTSGTSTAATAYATDCPAVVFGGISSGSAITVIPSGAYVSISFPCVAGAIYGIFENQSGENCTFTTTVQSSPTITSSSVTGVNLPFQIIPLMGQFTVQSFFATGGFYAAWANKGVPVGVGFRFNVTSGTAKLVGVLVETPIITQVPLTELITSGGGAYYEEVSDVDNGSRIIGTDTTGNRISFNANDCNGLMIILRTGQKSGIYSIEADGVVASAAFDTYSATASPLLLPLIVFPGAWPDLFGSSSVGLRLDNNFGFHSLKVKVTGTNASCLGSTAGVRVLEAVSAYKLNMR